MRGKVPAIAVGLVGVGMVIAGWAGDADWESVSVEIGASLALVIAILWIEDRWKSSVETRINAVEDSVAAGIQPDHVNASVERFLAKPTTGRLWTIATQLQALGLEIEAQVNLPGAGMVMLSPRSSTQVQLKVGARPGPLSQGGRYGIQWTDEMTLVEVFADVREALRQTGFEDDGEYLDPTYVLNQAGERYRKRVERHFAEDD